MIRFRTSQLESLPSESCSVRVRLGPGHERAVDAWFNLNTANPNITGPDLVAHIKTEVPKDETRTVMLTEEQDSELCINALEDACDPLSYGTDDILSDGCFLGVEALDRILSRLEEKKNVILQGPPGTGKTWLAKRLGMALIGQVVQEPQLRVVQFHPNISYEDFVRGWRPAGDGRLALHDGVFLQMVSAAITMPSQRYVLVIEEINRGNPAQIFGELLTLLEASKRTPLDSMQLAYPDPDGAYRPVHVPENLFVIGTMNIADRSLALVDLAFRRRFAFIDLEPLIGDNWRNWVVTTQAMDAQVAEEIQQRMTKLNEAIAADNRLGMAFRIGHSYVTPTQSLQDCDSHVWFAEVVASELRPLLQEYWFDAPQEAEKAAAALLEGW